MIKSWQEQYLKTRNQPPSLILVKGVSFVQNKGTAIDLGSGNLVDVKFLLSQGFKKVIAMDKELPHEELLIDLPEDRFEFIQSKYDEFEFPENQYDLVNAHYSLPFSSPKTFDKVWGSIEKSLVNGGIFTGQFFGINDQWNDKTRDMTFHTEQEIRNLLNNMEILNFAEEEIDRKLASGDKKHWHLFHVIAKTK